MRGPARDAGGGVERLIRLHYPNAGWVRLGHDTIAALAAYKSARGMLDLEDAVTTLLAEAPQAAQPEEVR